MSSITSKSNSFLATATSNVNPVTFSAGLGTVTAINLNSFRMGEYLWIWGTFNLGTAGATTAFLSLANGLTIDTSFYQSVQDALGTYTLIEKTAAPRTLYLSGGFNGVLTVDTSDTTGLYFSFFTSSDQFQKTTAAAAFVTNDYMFIDLKVKISGWTINS